MVTLDDAVEVLEERTQGEGANETINNFGLVKLLVYSNCIFTIEIRQLLLIIISLFQQIMSLLTLLLFILLLRLVVLIFLQDFRSHDDVIVFLFQRAHLFQDLRQGILTVPVAVFKSISIIFIRSPIADLVPSAAKLVILNFDNFIAL